MVSYEQIVQARQRGDREQLTAMVLERLGGIVEGREAAFLPTPESAPEIRERMTRAGVGFVRLRAVHPTGSTQNVVVVLDAPSPVLKGLTRRYALDRVLVARRGMLAWRTFEAGRETRAGVLSPKVLLARLVGPAAQLDWICSSWSEALIEQAVSRRSA